MRRNARVQWKMKITNASEMTSCTIYQWQIQQFLVGWLSLLCPHPSMFLLCPSLPWSGPINPARGSGGRFNLPLQAGQSPVNEHFLCFLSQKIAVGCNNLSDILKYDIFKKHPICNCCFCCFISVFTTLQNSIFLNYGSIGHGQKLLYGGGDAPSCFPLDLPPLRVDL